MGAGFWEFISLLCIAAGVMITFPYWGPALRAHYANVRVENEANARLLAEKLRAREEEERSEHRRVEELRTTLHRKQLALGEAEAIQAEALRDSVRIAKEKAIQSGDLEERGRAKIKALLS